MSSPFFSIPNSPTYLLTLCPTMATGHTATDYYNSVPSLAARFVNIDDPHNFQNCQQTLSDCSTRNFVLDFGDQNACCAFNLQTKDFMALMKEQVRAQPELSYQNTNNNQTQRPPMFGTRWM